MDFTQKLGGHSGFNNTFSMPKATQGSGKFGKRNVEDNSEQKKVELWQMVANFQNDSLAGKFKTLHSLYGSKAKEYGRTATWSNHKIGKTLFDEMLNELRKSIIYAISTSSSRNH